jgi:hypothetical protein
MAQNINIKNLGWLKNLKIHTPTGVVQGHLIGECFDDVSNAYGQLAAAHAATQAALDAALVRIAKLEKP